MSKGFTLLELLVVMVVVAILGTISIKVYPVIIEHSQRNTVEAVLRNMRAAERVYRMDNGEYLGITAIDSVANKVANFNRLKMDNPDNVDWRYGVETACCNPGGGSYTRCLPVVTRLRGPNAGKYLYIDMISGNLHGYVTDYCADSGRCSN